MASVSVGVMAIRARVINTVEVRIVAVRVRKMGVSKLLRGLPLTSGGIVDLLPHYRSRMVIG